MTTAEKYRSLIPLYGIIPMLMLLEEYEAGDEYEECEALVQGIRLHNARLNDNLPTSLEEAFFLEVDMKMEEVSLEVFNVDVSKVEIRGRDYWEPYLDMLKVALAGTI